MAFLFASSFQNPCLRNIPQTPQPYPSRRRAPRMTTAQQNIDDYLSQPSTESDIRSLQTWCKQHGINHPSLTISSDPRGLFTTTDITPPSTTISVPRQAALIADIATPDPPPLHFLTPLSSTFWEKSSWEIRLAVRLLDELARGSASPFAPYISALPRNPATMLNAYQQIGCSGVTTRLEKYSMHHVAHLYRASVKSSYVMFRAALPKHKRDVVSLRAFSWAVSIAQSRGFGIPPPDAAESNAGMSGACVDRAVPQEYALFPGLDMANHSVHCKTSFKYDKESCQFHVVTGSPFSNGDQYFLSYGPKSNDDLVFFYGFVEGNNPANTVKIMDSREWLLDISHRDGAEDEDWERKLEILKERGITLLEKPFELRLDGLDETMMQALRIAFATLEEIDKVVHTEDDAGKSKPLSLENELKVWHSVEYKCRHMLEEVGDFSEEEQERLTEMFEKNPTSAPWDWGAEGGNGELLYRYERQMVLSATQDRVGHFGKISSAVGRICTVLLPPSQSLLRTDIFDTGVSADETSGIHKFAISPQDLKFG